MKKNFFKRIYTVMELRTGFATGLPILSGGLFGAYLVDELRILPLILMFISGFAFNIVANIANEIRAFIKNEENEDTFTGHNGSEGLVRGDAKLSDAVIALLISLIIGGGSGLAVVLITGDLKILLIGFISVLAAICYSLGPKPYIVYPVGEIISGIFAGFISSLVSAYIQVGSFNSSIILYSIITMIMTVFLMSTNNTSDYEKDKGTRLTLPHVIGFKNSILLIIPEAIILFLCWKALLINNSINLYIFLVGIAIFYYFGYVKWYRDYYKIEECYKDMGREWGPKPLLLIYSFNYIMAAIFFIEILIG